MCQDVLEEEAKRMLQVSHNNGETVNYTEVKVLWYILQETPDSGNLSTELCKVMKQDK